MLGNLLNFVEPLLNMISIGRTDNSQVNIAGLGLGMTYLLAVNYTLGLGLSQGIQTFISQSYGKGDFHMVGVYLWRGRLLLCLTQIPFAVSLFFSYYSFKFIGIQEEQALVASEFCKASVYTVFIRQQMHLERYFLNSLQMNKAQTLFIFITIALHPLWLYFWVVRYDLGVTGVAIATSTTFTIELLLFLFYEYKWVDQGHPIKKMLIWPKLNELHPKDLWEQFVFGFHCFLMVAILIWAFEALIVFSSLLKNQSETSASVLWYQVEYMGFVIVRSISTASGALIGFEIGARNPAEAKRIARVSRNLVLSFTLFLVLVIYYVSPYLASLYSQDQDIKEKFVRISWAVLIAMASDCLLGIYFSFIKALGQQKKTTKFAIFSQMFLGIPSQALFGFYFGLGSEGFWLGLASGNFLTCLCFVIMLFHYFDWNKISDDTFERLQLAKIEKDEKEKLIN